MSVSERIRKRVVVVFAWLGRLLKGLFVSSTEMVLAVVLVLVFALVFLGILVLSFPKGTGLVSLYDELIDHHSGRADMRMRSGRGDDAAFVAVLQRVTRRVRDRPEDAFTWTDAHEGMRLEDHHTIQTLGRSAASIAFGDRGRLTLGERSLVVVKQEEQGSRRRRRHASVVLLGGKIQGALEVGKGRAPGLDIVTSGGTSEIRPGRKSGTEFSVTMNDDQSSTVCIYSGTAEITTSEGPLKVGPNEAITYDATGLLGTVSRIPDAPRPQFPPDGHEQTFGAVAPRVEFAWLGPEEVDSYLFVLARDRELADVVYAGELSRNGFTHGDLPAGRYYWSVSAVADRVESRPSRVRSFRLSQDLEPPELSVELPGEVVSVASIVIRGTTEPGSELFIENESVALDPNGGFEHALKLRPGLNMVVVEAVDAAGNTAYHSQYVTARF